MASKETKRFDNVLGKLHGARTAEAPAGSVRQEVPVPVPSNEKQKSNRKRQTFFVDKVLEEYIDQGTLHEMYRSKSDFVEHILMAYFKDKPYLQKK
ncbi:hypothetical protein [Pontibacter akesuensis]|uniref:Uncharacterized protein n=1 Tax=Pontibacter akesuensis TaxID=388950 RepID=A0A1I7KRA0_9BACT|nr:hypothetical protein [Pontibacter akesuensis]GHA81155.1 hypothetical protein GCM10007389_39490 [Pontibacter akesuensis]SFU99961.1 hypothetical protein SAMN04487941_4028 [Pontibacter akesuensis]